MLSKKWFSRNVSAIFLLVNSIYETFVYSQNTGSGADRPPSPPRSLASILRDQSVTNDFRTFLADLDEDAGEGDLRVKWLNFVLACRKLADSNENGNKAEVKKTSAQMREEFFSESQRVVLTNPAMWSACQAFLDGKKTSSKDKAERPLWKAHDDVVGKLDDLHQKFLLEHHVTARGKSDLPDLLQQCLL